jgi:hypothetical protein
MKEDNSHCEICGDEITPLTKSMHIWQGKPVIASGMRINTGDPVFLGADKVCSKEECRAEIWTKLWQKQMN